ncbi:uncharacterized protein LOC116350222 [Contarinia nasturtii]|uniref:uncharacterized protein LOC116350222 n=1 Tax=Contarinia nasturtii TaxID=265458 RepID=UPI0012D3EDD1|nr:uncharacterized protein LOC116350222 [Contarinia nasturtii]
MAKLICFVIVTLFLFWDGVKSDSFGDIASELNAKLIQNNEDAKDSSKEPNAVYKYGADAYAKQFIAFLEKLKDKTLSEEFENLDHEAWNGHYLMKLYASENLSNAMSLNGTEFQTLNLPHLHMKNTDVLRKIYYFLSDWVIHMFGDSSVKKCKAPISLGKVQVEKVRELYLEALQVIADTNCPQDRFKRFEIAFIYFYNIAKRAKGTKKFHEDALVLQGYQNLVNKRMSDASSVAVLNFGPSRSKKIPIPLTKKKIPIPKFIAKNPDEFTKYLQTKVKDLRGKMRYSGNLIAAFNLISNEIINLYHYIYQYAPEKFVVDNFDDLVRDFLAIYMHNLTTKEEMNTYIIYIAHPTFIRIFGPRKVKRVDTYSRDSDRTSQRY